jgi:hypothetical protein
MTELRDKTSVAARARRKFSGLVGAAVAAGFLLSACESFGPDRIPPDSFNYNQAMGQTNKEQMLLNLVRLRYEDVPVFLTVSSLLTQYIYAGSASVSASASGSSSSDSVIFGGVGGGVRYVERPTITYSPLTGEDFANQLLSPIPSDLLFSLLQSGFPADELLAMSLEKVGTVRNAPFDRPPVDNEEFRNFRRMVRLIIQIARHQAFEMQDAKSGDGEPGGGERVLVFTRNADPETQALIDEMKVLLDVDPTLSVYRLTENTIGRDPDEVTIRARSLLALMTFLAQGVELPASQSVEGRLTRETDTDDTTGAPAHIPLHVHSSVEKPAGAFISVNYRGYWYYVVNTDHRAKRVIGLLNYLFQLQAPKTPQLAPVLTVPTG